MKVILYSSRGLILPLPHRRQSTWEDNFQVIVKEPSKRDTALLLSHLKGACSGSAGEGHHLLGPLQTTRSALSPPVANMSKRPSPEGITTPSSNSPHQLADTDDWHEFTWSMSVEGKSEQRSPGKQGMKDHRF